MICALLLAKGLLMGLVHEKSVKERNRKPNWTRDVQNTIFVRILE